MKYQDTTMQRHAQRRAAPTQLLGFDKTTDPALDRLARLAAQVLRTPIALVTIVDADRQDVVGCVGLTEPWAAIHQSPLLHACCQSVVAAAAPLIIDDVCTHPLLHDHHPIAELCVLAYAGMPLITSDGITRGAFCVIDSMPRHWAADALDMLHELTTLVTEELDRQATAMTRIAEEQANRTNTALLHMIDHQLPLVVWTTDTELRLTSLSGTGVPDIPSDPTPFLGQPVSAYFATTGASSAMVRDSQEAHRQVLTGKTFAYQRELGRQTASVQIEPLRDDTGQIIGCLGLLLPLTAPIRLLHEVQAGRDRLQTLSTQLLHAQEAERRAIARELHDQIGQELTVIQMNLQDLLGVDPARLPKQLEDSIATVDRVLAQVRTMALDLRPSQLDDLGLAEALRWYLERHAARGHLEISFDLPPLLPRPAADVETTCFRIAQEAMTNILRSAHATHVWLTIGVAADKLTLTVRDDGRGFDVAAGRAGTMNGSSLGLLSMEERAALIGGRTMIESTPGQGTIVRAWLPLRAPGAAGAT
jgi:signal transduction histidine kinase